MLPRESHPLLLTESPDHITLGYICSPPKKDSVWPPKRSSNFLSCSSVLYLIWSHFTAPSFLPNSLLHETYFSQTRTLAFPNISCNFFLPCRCQWCPPSMLFLKKFIFIIDIITDVPLPFFPIDPLLSTPTLSRCSPHYCLCPLAMHTSSLFNLLPPSPLSLWQSEHALAKLSLVQSSLASRPNSNAVLKPLLILSQRISLLPLNSDP